MLCYTVTLEPDAEWIELFINCSPTGEAAALSSNHHVPLGMDTETARATSISVSERLAAVGERIERAAIRRGDGPILLDAEACDDGVRALVLLHTPVDETVEIIEPAERVDLIASAFQVSPEGSASLMRRTYLLVFEPGGRILVKPRARGDLNLERTLELGEYGLELRATDLDSRCRFEPASIAA